MSRAKVPIVRLSDMVPGQTVDCFALLAERSRGVTREGKPFFTCRFRDARRTVSFPVWEDGPWFKMCESDWHEGRIYKIRATLFDHDRYGLQLDLQLIREATPEDQPDGFDPLDFVERTRFDPAAMLAELKRLAEESIADEPLRRLTVGLLDHHADALKVLPASLRNYFTFAGGWLEHTLNVTRTCLDLADRYRKHYPELKPPLNRDLLCAAAVLHEIGRVVELEPSFPAQPTVTGRLFGHLLLGRDRVREAARAQGDVNPELLELLEHVLMSYLALPEWGSPRLPLIPEAVILHHADDLDAKLEQYVHCLTHDPSPGPFTERDPVLGRQLYKGRSL